MLRLGLILALIAAGPAAAQDAVRCTPDPEVDLGLIDDGPGGLPGVVRPETHGGGSATCRTPEGVEVPAHRSADGVLTIRDADGNTLYGQTDVAGITTFVPDPPAPLRPPIFTTTPDGAGGVMLRDEAGNVYTPMTDELGNSTIHTESGQVLRCHTIGQGHTVCD
jgi:hypothetical protein